ncbi:hypothetical protein ET475_03440 [Microbacterium protaetiae]|uniref:ESX-1 secretion-associated protein n=1 Tax=Microbacterium protaetiae TaxID=2509458 RepID=A0A4P6EG64_9MICO|nr:hypothetical protein [Microbacterium protaetiae]QAY59137.1 hypothetical protein ET475_03440 [Microbacterium protaetiae]
MTDIAASFDALSKDAEIWDAAGDTLSQAQSDLNGIGVYRGAFSFAALDIADQYAQLHQTVSDLLGDGATNTRAGAAALRAVRADFEKYEDITRCDLYDMWQPE